LRTRTNLASFTVISFHVVRCEESDGRAEEVCLVSARNKNEKGIRHGEGTNHYIPELKLKEKYSVHTNIKYSRASTPPCTVSNPTSQHAINLS
jgi:hypothetical protein